MKAGLLVIPQIPDRRSHATKAPDQVISWHPPPNIWKVIEDAKYLLIPKNIKGPVA